MRRVKRVREWLGNKIMLLACWVHGCSDAVHVEIGCDSKMLGRTVEDTEALGL